MTEQGYVPETVIAFAGDWHGDRPWALQRIADVARRGVSTMIHVGDFGIWPGDGGKRFLRDVERACAEHDVALLVVPGNHEDWGRLVQLWNGPRGRDEHGVMLPLYLTDHIAVLPRGYRWEMAGRTFVALGGAPSVDFESRNEGRSWWPEEQMTSADVERTVAGGPAEVMVAHDSPGPPWCTPAVESILASNPWGWSDRALAYATAGRERVEAAFAAVKPRLFVHGHYHVSDEAAVQLDGAEHATRIWSLHMSPHVGNVRLLDLSTLTDPRGSR